MVVRSGEDALSTLEGVTWDILICAWGRSIDAPALMVEARRLAESGAYSGFNQIQQKIARKYRETGLVLRLWATAADCDAINKLCLKVGHPA